MTDDPLREIRHGLSAVMESVARIDERTKILTEKVEGLATTERVAEVERKVDRHDKIVARVSWAAIALIGGVVAHAVGLRPPTHF